MEWSEKCDDENKCQSVVQMTKDNLLHLKLDGRGRKDISHQSQKQSNGVKISEKADRQEMVKAVPSPIPSPGSSLPDSKKGNEEQEGSAEVENGGNYSKKDEKSEKHVSKSRAPLLFSSRSHLDKTSFIISEKDDFDKPDSAIFPAKVSKARNSIQSSGLGRSLKGGLKPIMVDPQKWKWRQRLFGFQIKRHYWDNYDKKYDSEILVQSQKENQDIRYRFKKYFTVMHVIFALLGGATIGTGTSLAFVEAGMRGNLEINLTEYPKKLYIGTGSSIIILAIAGQCLMLVRKFKTLTWLTYLCMLCVLVTAAGSCCYTSMKTYEGAHTARKTLLQLMNEYDNNGERNSAVTKVDILQKGYQCCGVDNFLDWSAFPSGRTSLRTPLSCCRGYPEVKDEYCSQNLLPDATVEEADETIYAKGCLTVMMHDMNTWCLGTGIFTGILVFLFVIHLLFSFFLMTSRRF